VKEALGEKKVTTREQKAFNRKGRKENPRRTRSGSPQRTQIKTLNRQFAKESEEDSSGWQFFAILRIFFAIFAVKGFFVF